MNRTLRQNLYLIPVFLCIFGMVIYPKQALRFSMDGLITYATIVLPALLPFFICSSLITGSMLLLSLSRKLDKVMRWIFACPGCTALPLLVSLLSGYPTGSRMVAQLYQGGYLSDTDCAKAAYLCSTSGPMFVLGAVGTALYQSPAIGWRILLCHYLSVFLTSAIINHSLAPSNSKQKWPTTSLMPHRTFGTIILDSCMALLSIGGYIVIFSVFIGVLTASNILPWITQAISPILQHSNLPAEITTGILSAILELSNGCKNLIIPAMVPKLSIPLVCAGISWSGLSVLLQSIDFLSDTPVNPSGFFAAKAAQSATAFIIGTISLFIFPL